MDEISQYWVILRRRWLPASIVFAVVFAISAIKTLQQKPVYQATGQIIFKKTTSGADILGVGKEIGNAEAANRNNLNTQAQLISSIPVAQQTIATLNLSQKPESFLKPLQVAPLKSTDILGISYVDTDPAKAARIINTVMDVYIQNDVMAQRTEAKAAREFVEQQLPKMEMAVLEAEGNLRKFKEQYKVVDSAAEATAAQAALSDVDTKITSARSQLAIETARMEKLRQLFGKDLDTTIRTGLVSETAGLQKALAELQDVQQKLALERTRFQESHPVIADLKSKEAALQATIQQRTGLSVVGSQQIPNNFTPVQGSDLQKSLLEDYSRSEVERSSLQKQISALAQIEANYKQRSNILPKLEQQQRELERKLKAAQSTYELLLTKLQEIRVTENQTLGNARIATPALVPDRPIGPNKPKDLATGGLLGILVAVGTALALDALDKTIKTLEDAKKLLDYPVLGIIPIFGKAEGITTVRYGNQRQSIPEVVVRNAPGSPVSEAFGMLQTNLRFMSLDNQLKVIVISSSIPQEGKSTTAANLAVAMAQLGRRVLIVDADMRKPSQQSIWKIPNEVGLSSVLTGQSELNEALVDVMENLDVLPAGITPPNPLVLLDSTQMAVLVGQWAQTYDFVIIDSPPLTIAADTTILCKMANGLVFVVRPGVADAGSVTYCKEILEQSGQTVLGMVVNGVRPNSSNYYNYYYYRNKTQSGVADQQPESVKRRVS
ncbi:MAG TPA: polysaccharide biosynthesis tyrosine autokinase [Candidatus Obscuribacterales bacterium]